MYEKISRVVQVFCSWNSNSSKNESPRIGRSCWTLLQGWSSWTVPKAWIFRFEFVLYLLFLCPVAQRIPIKNGIRWKHMKNQPKSCMRRLLERFRCFVVEFQIHPKNESPRIGRSCWTLLQGWSSWTVPKAWIFRFEFVLYLLFL